MTIQMKSWVLKNLDYVNWDRIGMGLSALCVVHCLVTPFIILSIPILARYYLVHPLFHLLLAIAIIPVGLFAFVSGYKHHRKYWVFVLGIPGLVIVTAIPYLVHGLGANLNEPMMMVVGSGLLLSGHWFNRRACSDCEHHSTH